MASNIDINRNGDRRNDVHREFAIELFNLTWDLMEKRNRSEAENETMINAAHASRFHWGVAGGPLNFARGEWQISRVYALVSRPEPALYHAKKSLQLCQEHQLGALDLGFAYESMARAYAVKGNLVERDAYLGLAVRAASEVSKQDSKTWLLRNIETVRWLGLPQWE